MARFPDFAVLTKPEAIELVVGFDFLGPEFDFVELFPAFLFGRFAFLRFEASFLSLPFLSELCKLIQGAVPGALVRGLVAHVEGEFLLRGGVIGFVEGGGLQAKSTVGEPLMLRDAGDESVFGEGGRGVLFAEGGEQVAVIFHVLVV